MQSIGDLAGCAADHLDIYAADPTYAWPAYDEDPHPRRLTAMDLLAPELLAAGLSWRQVLPMANRGDGVYRDLWDVTCGFQRPPRSDR